MKQPAILKTPWFIPGVVAALAVAALAFWFARDVQKPLDLRLPGTDRAPERESGGGSNPVLAGKVIPGDGQPSTLPGAWPEFRGTNFDGICRDPTPLLRSWPAGEPRELWGIDVGEGYAAPAVLNGRVYLMDYDRERQQDALRCLSLADGKEIWRYVYPVSVKRNHGMSRTVPFVNDKVVVAMGPKCHVVCADAATGALRWGMDLVREQGTTVPQWYAGQCPLVEGGHVVLAPGGKNALLLAVEVETGKPVWQTPNPHRWKMTHASILPMDFEGERMYVYCADKGVVGVSAEDGRLLWETTEWKINIATVPSPVAVGGGRIFLSGGYKAGSMMLQLKKEEGRYSTHTVFRLGEEVFGATQQTPVLYNDHIYGVRPDGKFVCLTLEGEVLWSSTGPQFGLGPFMLAGDLIFAMNDSGLLRLLEATPQNYSVLGEAEVFKKGDSSWGPLALAGGRLLARDLTRLVCLDVGLR